jgi:hypothetical protein
LPKIHFARTLFRAKQSPEKFVKYTNEAYNGLRIIKTLRGDGKVVRAGPESRD